MVFRCEDQSHPNDTQLDEARPMNTIEAVLSYLGQSIKEIMDNMTPEEVASSFARDVHTAVPWDELLTVVYYIRSRRGRDPMLIRR